MKNVILNSIISIFLVIGFSTYVFASGAPQVKTKNPVLNNPTGVTIKTVNSKSFRTPEGIAISSDGDIWVANWSNDTVTELNNDYKVIGSYNVGHVFGWNHRNPQNIAIDASGNIWVSNGDATISELSPTGAFLKNLNSGTWSNDIVISPGGLIWALAIYNNKTWLDEITPQGEIVGKYIIGVRNPRIIGNQNVIPHNIAIDANGNIWATTDNAVVNVNMSANTILKHPAGLIPWGIAIAPSGNIFIADHGSGGWLGTPGHSIMELNPEGAIFSSITTGKFPKQIAIDTDGDIWVTNQGTNSVTKYSPQGLVLGSYHVGKTPWGIAIAHNGDVIVSDKGSNTLTIIKGAETTPEYFPYSGPQWP